MAFRIRNTAVQRLQGYGLALAVTAAATILRSHFQSVLGGTPFLAFYPAVVVAAVFGGTGPGILATVASTLCVGLLFDPTPGLENIDEPAMLIRLALFLAGGIGTSLAAGSMRASRAHARQQAESLRESQERHRIAAEELRAIMDAAPGGICVAHDPQCHLITGNRMAHLLLGVPTDGDISLTPGPGKAPAAAHFRMLRDGEELAPGQLPMQVTCATGTAVRNEELEVVHRDGTHRFLLLNASPLRSADGTIRGAVAAFADITQRKQAEQSLRQSESRFRQLADAMPQIVWASRPDGALDYYNRRWYELTGAQEGASGDQSWLPVMHPDDRQKCLDIWYESVRTGKPYQIEYRFRFPASGEYRWHLGRALPVRDEAGNIIRWYGTCTDIHDLKCAQEQIRLHSAALEAAANAIAITDPGGTIVWVNSAFCKLTGYSREESIGQNPRFLKSGMQKEAFYRHLWNTIGRGEVWHGELLNRRKDGSLYTEEMAIAPLRSGQGAIINFIAVKQDVSARKAEQQALAAARVSAERAKAIAEDASKAKDHFLAVLSHELRTPLTPVVAAVSMLQEQMEGDAAQRETLEMIRRNVEMEARLIDDLLDVTRIVRGKVELDRKPISLCAVIRRAVEVCKPDIEARQLHFGINIDDTAPYRINADPARLQQVFWNLLKNAIKFTPHGGCIGIRCRHEDAQVVVEVTDSGEGIEPALLPHIFNAFEQGGARVTRQFGGLGLGLTITKGLVEMHDGAIEAHSEGKGKGATFRVRLPMIADGVSQVQGQQQPADTARPKTNDQGPMTPLRILLVEDHGDTAKIMRRLLMTHGHHVQMASDVATALELAEQEPFDLLLSDLGLPDGSGIDLLRKLRKRGNMAPAIALSGYGQEEDIRRSKEAGFAAHLTKPTNLDKLIEAIGAITRPGGRSTESDPSIR